ncbi:Alpha-agarase precursor [Chryseobacterium gleum]|uniref:Alpha-agarase n=2 Tax=Chryseobacterium gleum TaxID=250 RepID=A0A448B159_CHRGE|nr:VWA domain-containing protein [Chryseobacterium gleum]EFK33615.1 von Willebrand factor type A domain protein [Chryseobacterium gleum ATCC 35910]VEE06702.1 Alpha-agarase precursor [Chryseobacterium gleum]
MKKIVITMLGLAALTSCKTQKNTETSGEPKTYSVRKDKDQDGIPNKLDKCPDIAGPVENEGCPWPESDGDGVIDKDDACPTVAGPPENNGCPWPDADGDGILDKDDACPTVPGLPEYNGCPKPKSVTAMEVERSIKFPESGRVYDHQVGDKKNVKKTTKKTGQDIDYNNEEYVALVENAFELTRNQPVSTFSIDVDNASYSNIRRMISYGGKVDKNSVRVEEMINYFKYDYPQPGTGHPFSINTEYGNSPWNPKHKLLKIGLQGKNIPMDKLPASNIVFLIDVSGSMSEENKLPLLKSSLKVLLKQLRPKDKVGIVVYAGNAGMVLPSTSAGEKEKIIKALDNLQAGGSTAGGAGIELAYKLAKENFIKGGNNRVVLATDGDFNVGASSTSDIETLITEKRKTGIFLTCLGYGMGNYKDNTMEVLADKGNGNYAYIDNMQEANKFLGREFAGNIYTIAKDVKVQIEFNPKYVKSYRLIGYENRKLRNEDFANDKIDAGELGSGHTVTALYEVIPANVNSEFTPKETKLKYSEISKKKNFGDEMATVKFRYKKPDGDKSIEITKVIKEDKSSVSPDFKFASSVAWFGLVLRNSELITKKDLSDIETLAKQGKSKDEEGYRSEFIRLIESYKTIQK